MPLPPAGSAVGGFGSVAEPPAVGRAVLIATRRPVMAAGLAAWLSPTMSVDPTPVASSGEAIRAARSRDVFLLVVFADVNPVLVVGEVSRTPAPPRMLVITDDDPSLWDEVALLSLGAHGVLTARSSSETLRSAVTSICDGRAVATPGALQMLSAPAARPLLTFRQRQIMSLLSEGATTPEIARALSISPATVTTHIRRLADRFGARGKRGLERLARRGIPGQGHDAGAAGGAAPPIGAFMSGAIDQGGVM